MPFWALFRRLGGGFIGERFEGCKWFFAGFGDFFAIASRTAARIRRGGKKEGQRTLPTAALLPFIKPLSSNPYRSVTRFRNNPTNRVCDFGTMIHFPVTVLCADTRGSLVPVFFSGDRVATTFLVWSRRSRAQKDFLILSCLPIFFRI